MKVDIKDELLLDRWLCRQPEALAGLLSQYGSPFYGFLVAACGGIEETAQEFFAKVFFKALHSQELESRKISIYLELFRCAVKELRSAAKEVSVPSKSQVLDRLSVDRDIKTRLLLCLKILTRISFEERIMILLRELGELEIPEMACVMNLAENELRRRLNEARIHFREKTNELLRNKDFYELRRD